MSVVKAPANTVIGSMSVIQGPVNTPVDSMAGLQPRFGQRSPLVSPAPG